MLYIGEQVYCVCGTYHVLILRFTRTILDYKYKYMWLCGGWVSTYPGGKGGAMFSSINCGEWAHIWGGAVCGIRGGHNSLLKLASNRAGPAHHVHTLDPASHIKIHPSKDLVRIGTLASLRTGESFHPYFPVGWYLWTLRPCTGQFNKNMFF